MANRVPMGPASGRQFALRRHATDTSDSHDEVGEEHGATARTSSMPTD